MATAKKIFQIGEGAKGMAIAGGVLVVAGVVGYTGYKFWKGANTVARVADDSVESVKQTAKEVFAPETENNIISHHAETLWGYFTDGQGSIGTDVYDFFQ